MSGRRKRTSECRWHIVFLWSIVAVGALAFISFHYYALLPHPDHSHDTRGKVDLRGSALADLADAPSAGQHLVDGPSSEARRGASRDRDGGGDIRGRSGAPAARGPTASYPESWVAHTTPVELELRLPNEVLNQPALKTHAAMLRQYGFNLNLSNHIPLLRTVPDHRNDACKARQWPPLNELPKASVIVIFYNEPLSTLLRNVVGILNRSPPELLGEVLIIDDNSNLAELKYLGEHLERLKSKLPSGKVRFVRRDVHDGIVGARNRGVQEALYPVVVILDSHAEVTHGWLEPLLGRIHGDRTRVIVPNIVPINIETMAIEGGGTWPPLRGSFTWRLSFTILPADTTHDIIEHDVDKKCSAIKTPVMPGGLFAMDREYFFETGMYDPEIHFYGAEHVEMSFRIWTCGGTMEIGPCSHIGHIYREFDRFGVDTQLHGVNIGSVLDRNDARVAEVWMDDYKRHFYKFRPMPGKDLGDLRPRQELRTKLQCKPFKWFLDEVCRDMYVPDVEARSRHIFGLRPLLCLDHGGKAEGELQLRGCQSHSENQKLDFTKDGYLQFTWHFDQKLICVRVQIVSQVACSRAPDWLLKSSGELESAERPGMCLDRGIGNGGEQPDLQNCSGALRQRWKFKLQPGGRGGTLSDRDDASCIDNMQRSEGVPGLYGCHGGLTQQWLPLAAAVQGKIRSAGDHGADGVCLGFAAEARVAACAVDDPNFAWLIDGPEGRQKIRPTAFSSACLERTQDDSVRLVACRGADDGDVALQQWHMGAPQSRQ